METENSVPVIDLQDFPRQSSKLIWACEEWGCFRILNHDKILPFSLMAEMKKVVRTLLDLPTEIKKRNKDVIPGSGYVPLTEKNPLYESLGLHYMSSPQDVDAFCTQLGASPHQSILLSRVEGLSEIASLPDFLGSAMDCIHSTLPDSTMWEYTGYVVVVASMRIPDAWLLLTYHKI